MIMTKILETFVDLTDPLDMFAHDRDQMIIDKLITRFVGICFNSCYILKINRIIKRSFIYMKDTLEGDAQSSVQFEADVIVYRVGEIINGCKIIKKEPSGIVHGASDHAGIQIDMNPAWDIYKEGDVIPVIVRRVRYNVNQDAVSVLASPLVPGEFTQPPMYQLAGFSHGVPDTAKTLIKQIAIAEQRILKMSAQHKKIYAFFADLLSQDKVSGASSMHVTDLTKAKLNPNTVIAMAGGRYNNTQVVIIDKPVNFITESFDIVYTSMLMTYLGRLQTLESFVDHYQAFADVQKHKNIWKMYSILKKKMINAKKL
jgi:hypothetical protein